MRIIQHQTTWVINNEFRFILLSDFRNSRCLLTCFPSSIWHPDSIPSWYLERTFYCIRYILGNSLSRFQFRTITFYIYMYYASDLS